MLEGSGKYIDLSSTLKQDFQLPVYFNSTANFGIYWLSCQRSLNYLHNKTVIHIDVSYDIDIAIMQDRTILKNAIRIPGAFGNFLVTDCTGTVSYTHLDVYKRQLHNCANISPIDPAPITAILSPNVTFILSTARRQHATGSVHAASS